jgi:hypothetical protein
LNCRTVVCRKSEFQRKEIECNCALHSQFGNRSIVVRFDNFLVRQHSFSFFLFCPCFLLSFLFLLNSLTYSTNNTATRKQNEFVEEHTFLFFCTIYC